MDIRRYFQVANEDNISSKPKVVFFDNAPKITSGSKVATNMEKQETVKTEAKPTTIENKPLVAFCDGSAINNGKKNCKCGYAVVFPEHRDRDIMERLGGAQQTNNRAEYMALIRAMDIANVLDAKKEKTLIVYTDSKLLIDSLTKWVFDWKRRGWKKKDGFPVANVDLLIALEDRRAKRRLVLRHVKAHTGAQTWEAIHNDIVDKMARKAALS